MRQLLIILSLASCIQKLTKVCDRLPNRTKQERSDKALCEMGAYFRCKGRVND